MKLKTNTIDFEALVKNLPIVNPFTYITETSNIFDYHMKTIKPESENEVREEK